MAGWAGPLAEYLPRHRGRPGHGLQLQNYFDGLINNVRLWNIARTGNEIRDGMFTVTNAVASSPKPVAEWRLAGDVVDYANTFGFDGIAHYITFSNDGALPHDIRIPLVSASPTLNGSCDATKYNGSIELTDFELRRPPPTST